MAGPCFGLGAKPAGEMASARAIPFYGEHQAGIATPAPTERQAVGNFVAFDVTAANRRELADLFRGLTAQGRLPHRRRPGAGSSTAWACSPVPGGMAARRRSSAPFTRFRYQIRGRHCLRGTRPGPISVIGDDQLRRARSGPGDVAVGHFLRSEIPSFPLGINGSTIRTGQREPINPSDDLPQGDQLVVGGIGRGRRAESTTSPRRGSNEVAGETGMSDEGSGRGCGVHWVPPRSS